MLLLLRQFSYGLLILVLRVVLLLGNQVLLTELVQEVRVGAAGFGIGSFYSSVVYHSCCALELVLEGTCELCPRLFIFAAGWKPSNLLHIDYLEVRLFLLILILAYNLFI